jgi:hypothetical protein
MHLRWSLPFLEEPNGYVEIERSRTAVAAKIHEVLPLVRVRAETLTFVPLGNGRAQVNVHGFGPFGVVAGDEASSEK